MMSWLNERVTELKRYTTLNGFWRTRTVFYRDAAKAIAAKEQFSSFVDGELKIACDPKTANTNRAKGLAFLSSIIQVSDLLTGAQLRAVMPKSDGMALSTLDKAKDIPAALVDIADNIEKQQAMAKIMKMALVSPAIILTVAYAFAYVYATKVIPAFVKAATAEVWDDFYNGLIRSSSTFIDAYGHWFALALVIAVLIIVFWALENYTASWRYKMENSSGWKRVLWVLVFPFQPIFSIYRDIHGSNMLGSLANLMKSGMALGDALEVLSQNAQPWMRGHIDMVRSHLNMAEGDYTGAFSHGILPKFLLSRMGSLLRRNGGGNFSNVMIELGVLGATESQEHVQKTAKNMNFALTALGMSVVLFFYIGQGSIVSAIERENSPAAQMKRNLKKGEKIQTEPAAEPAAAGKVF